MIPNLSCDDPEDQESDEEMPNGKRAKGAGGGVKPKLKVKEELAGSAGANVPVSVSMTGRVRHQTDFFADSTTAGRDTAGRERAPVGALTGAPDQSEGSVGTGKTKGTGKKAKRPAKVTAPSVNPLEPLAEPRESLPMGTEWGGEWQRQEEEEFLVERCLSDSSDDGAGGGKGKGGHRVIRRGGNGGNTAQVGQDLHSCSLDCMHHMLLVVLWPNYCVTDLDVHALDAVA